MTKYDLPKFVRPRGTVFFEGKPKDHMGKFCNSKKSGAWRYRIWHTGTHRYYLQVVAAGTGRQLSVAPLMKDDVHYYVEENS